MVLKFPRVGIIKTKYPKRVYMEYNFFKVEKHFPRDIVENRQVGNISTPVEFMM